MLCPTCTKEENASKPGQGKPVEPTEEPSPGQGPGPTAEAEGERSTDGESSDQGHDQRVADYINEVLKTFDRPYHSAAANLALAQAHVQGQRDGDSLDLLKRDAEYYLKARALVAATPPDRRAIYSVGGVAAIAGYNGLKALGIEMRQDPNSPNAPPRGTDWAWRGANDGCTDPYDVHGPLTPVTLD